MAALNTLNIGETIRGRVEQALIDGQVDLTTEAGRASAAALIEEALQAFRAEQLAGNGDLPVEVLEAVGRELRDELIGLGAIAEQMAIQTPTRVSNRKPRPLVPFMEVDRRRFRFPSGSHSDRSTWAGGSAGTAESLAFFWLGLSCCSSLIGSPLQIGFEPKTVARLAAGALVFLI
jgi:hypothetical protein